MDPGLQVSVLGDLEVLRDGVPLPLGGRKPRTLLGLLVAARGRTVGTERLVDELWRDDPPPKVLTALQVYVAKLRRSLEPDRGPRDSPSVLVTRTSGYALVLPDDAVDARRFEDLVSAAGEDRLAGAMALWRGTPYAGLHDAPALAAEAQRLGELRLRAIEQLWSARLDGGRHADAVSALTALVAEHPARERLWAMLVLALYRSGRQADALDALRRVRTHLADELGIDPSAQLRELETAVLRQDAFLLQTSVPAAAPSSPPSVATAVPAVLAGRDGVLARASAAVARTAAGTGGVLLVTGEPGIGKTRFAEAVLVQAARAGLRPVSGGGRPKARRRCGAGRRQSARSRREQRPATTRRRSPTGSPTSSWTGWRPARVPAWYWTTCSGRTPTASGSCAGWPTSSRPRRCWSSSCAANPGRRPRHPPSPPSPG